MKRYWLFCSVLILILGFLANSGYGEKPLVDLDANNLPLGNLKEWVNQGTVGGRFECLSVCPQVEIVAGLKAVTFNGKDQILKSTFIFPESIARKRSFSVALWIFDPEIGRKKIILSWASRPQNSTEFSIGRAYDGAFCSDGIIKVGYEGGIPLSKAWHHLAFIYDGNTLRVYVNGELNVEKLIRLNTKEGGNIYLGAGWNSERNSPYSLFSGSIAKVQVYDYALSALEIRNSIGYFSAFDPSPRNGENIETLKTAIKWKKGCNDIAAFEVFLSENKEEIERSERNLPSYRGIVPSSQNFFGPLEVIPGKTYFWRIDQLDSQGRVKQRGEVWSFQVDPGQAKNPFPRNKVAGVKKDLREIRWTPGRWAKSQTLYFDVSLEKVQSRNTLIIEKLGPEVNRYSLSLPLKYGVTYYWRVDTDNGCLPAAEGEIWSFRVEDEFIESDITFFLVSDTHYGATISIADANRATIDIMNSLPGTKYPEKAGGGIVRTPRGVLVLGDLVDEGSAQDAMIFWKEFVDDYGINGERRLAYPVYEGVGNHDGGPEDTVRRGVRKRNLERKNLTGISSNGLHYSWDWGRVHFVQINLYPGSSGDDIINPWGGRFEGSWKDPEHSLEFLIDDLSKNVGQSGRPVIILQHYGFDEWSKGWWSENERLAFYDAIKDYNVIAIFWGHSHVSQMLNWKGINTWCVGSGQRDPEPGEFFVVNINPKEMIVAERKRDGWGLVFRIEISNNPAGVQKFSQFDLMK
jgi:hypothetical protein